LLLLLILVSATMTFMNPVFPFKPLLDNLLLLLPQFKHFGFFSALDDFLLLDDILLHLLDVFRINFDNGRVFLNDVTFDMPLFGLGDLHYDLCAEYHAVYKRSSSR
jgi:hypothetical protein